MPMSCQKSHLIWLATFYHMHNVKLFIEPFVTNTTLKVQGDRDTFH